MAEATLSPVMRVKELKVHYKIRGSFLNLKPPQFLKAVDGVSMELQPWEILGLVGESGCGKSSLGRSILRLNEPTSGEVEIDGIDFLKLRGSALRNARPKIQMIFQDPYASLDPRMTVYDILSEPLRAHRKLRTMETGRQIHRFLDLVGLPSRVIKRYPHEFSGGQRQRIAIARALILEPKVIIADEPVSSLDVSVQAQILNLLKQIQRQMGLSLIFISHNLAVVKYIADRIAVMYLGKIVEIAHCRDLYASPQHPYTKALISAVPIPDPRLERTRERVPLIGELPSRVNPPSGCPFHPRCPIAFERCPVEVPQLKTYPTLNRKVSCFAVDKQ